MHSGREPLCRACHGICGVQDAHSVGMMACVKAANELRLSEAALTEEHQAVNFSHMDGHNKIIGRSTCTASCRTTDASLEDSCEVLQRSHLVC